MKEEYSYQKPNSLLTILSICISVLMFVFGFKYLYDFIMTILTPEQSMPISNFHNLWIFLGYSIWSPFIFIYGSQIISDVNVNESGLQIKFLLKKFQIKWEDLSEIRSYTFLGIAPTKSKKAKVVFVNNSLTSFHRFYGILNGTKNQRAFVIDDSLENFDGVIR